MRQSLDNVGFEGSVLVIKNGKTYLNYATANKTDTSYLINSVQKFITGAAIMKAVQEGKLSLNAVSYTHLTLPTTLVRCRSRWSPYH